MHSFSTAAIFFAKTFVKNRQEKNPRAVSIAKVAENSTSMTFELLNRIYFESTQDWHRCADGRKKTRRSAAIMLQVDVVDSQHLNKQNPVFVVCRRTRGGPRFRVRRDPHECVVSSRCGERNVSLMWRRNAKRPADTTEFRSFIGRRALLGARAGNNQDKNGLC